MMTYIFATIVCLFVEMPVSALQKLYVPEPKKQIVGTKENGVSKKSNGTSHEGNGFNKKIS